MVVGENAQGPSMQCMSAFKPRRRCCGLQVSGRQRRILGYFHKLSFVCLQADICDISSFSMLSQILWRICDRQYYSMYYSSSPRNSVIAVKYPKVCRLYKACISIHTMERKQGVHILCQMPCSGAYRRSRVLVFWVEVETESGSPVALQQSNQVVQLTF